MAVMVIRHSGVSDVAAHIEALTQVEGLHAELCAAGSPCRAEATVRRLQSIDDPTVVLIIVDGFTPENWAAWGTCKNTKTAMAAVMSALPADGRPTLDAPEHFTEVWAGTYH
ncbi:MAG: hypothetical protein WCI29_12690 [Actinomycetes bacterium]